MVKKKQCTTCGEWKPVTTDFWYKQKLGKYGLKSKCKVCCIEYRKEHYENNRGRIAEYKKEYRENNKEQIAEYMRKYRENNKEQILERTREYRENNREQRLKYAKKYHENNREQRLEHMRTWRENNKEHIAEYRQRPDVKERKRIRRLNYLARKKALPNTFTPEQWQECLSYFDHSCAVCGEPQNLFIQLEADHWIPLFNDDCTGTVVSNMIPLCGGSKFDSHTGCNQSKGCKDPMEWLEYKYDTRKAQQIYNRIMDYFEWVESQDKNFAS